MASSNLKPRQPRLRASCDGCFLAKVKCSKARPLCARCLTCGIECRYSPSSRTGKPKSDASSNVQASTQAELSAVPAPLPADDILMFPAPQSMAGYYKMEEGWNSPPSSVDEGMSRSHSMSGLAMVPIDAGASQEPPLFPADMYSASGGMNWATMGDFAAQFAESAAINATLGTGRPHSYDFGPLPTSMPPWMESNAPDAYIFSPPPFQTPGNAPTNYFPSPVATPQLRPTPRFPSSPTSPASSGGPCTCFIACLQSLHALHNASTPAMPPFDSVLSTNRKAVEGCAAMLGCERCISRSGTHTAAMVLSTVIGRVTSVYKKATHVYFDSVGAQSPSSPNPGGVGFGAYTVMGEDNRWFELEILARELKKLEEVYAEFKEMCAELYEDPEVTKAMTGYLGHIVGATVELVQERKETAYASAGG